MGLKHKIWHPHCYCGLKGLHHVVIKNDLKGLHHVVIKNTNKYLKDSRPKKIYGTNSLLLIVTQILNGVWALNMNVNTHILIVF
jgi:hypothetical protein